MKPVDKEKRNARLREKRKNLSPEEKRKHREYQNRAQEKWNREHPEHAKVRAKEYRERNKEKLAAAYRNKKYNITDEQFVALIAKQANRCGICDRVFDPSDRALSPRVDHDHEYGVIRGLLCNGCNVGLGFLGDNETGVQRALQYVQRWRKEALACLTTINDVHS
jgi:hypothetical protein